MIRDARFLKDDHVPNQLPHRNDELNHLSSILEAKPGEIETNESVFVFGPTGAGKTCVGKRILQKLEEEALGIRTNYVDCWHDYTRFKALYRVLEGIGESVDIHRGSTPNDELVERVQQYEGVPYVVILDEVDELEDDRVLYDLHHASNISLILITNDEDEFFTNLDDRVISRLRGSPQLYLEKYELRELTDILSIRAERGLDGNPVREDGLETIADAAAGDAREGINILRHAAKRARQQGNDQISNAIIDEAIPSGKAEVRQKNLDQLKPHQRILYNILEEHQQLNPGDLYTLYRERVDDPRSDRTLREYLSKLERYNLVKSEGEKRGRTYRLVTK